MTQSSDRKYLIRLVDEPDTPMVLDQADFDVLMDLGAAAPPPEDEAAQVDFATVETSDGGPFLHRGAELPEDSVAVWAGRAMEAAIRAALEHHRDLLTDAEAAGAPDDEPGP